MTVRGAAGMDFVAYMSVMARRWYVVVPGLLVTAAAIALALTTVGPSYAVTGSVILTYPKPSGESSSSNPYLGYGSLLVPAHVVREVATEREFARTLRSQGATEDYNVAVDTMTGSPLLVVEVTGTSREDVLMTARTVMQSLRTVLEQRQSAAGAPPQTWIGSLDVVEPTAPVAEYGNQLRAVVGLGLVGLTGTAVAAVITDSLLARRARRQEATRAAVLFSNGMTTNSGSASSGALVEPDVPAAAADPRRPEGAHDVVTRR
jgi:hypothetical protein